MSKPSYDLNKEIEAFVLRKDSPYSQEDINFVNQYTGYGGMWKQDANLEPRRGLYEYYTPTGIVELMIGLANIHGYKGGPVLEPSCGIGRFLHYFSPDIDVTGVEPDKVSYRIAQANFPNFKFINSTFNELFVDRRNNPIPYDKKFDLVIGNPPYGAFDGRHTVTEKKIVKPANYVEYFLYRAMYVLNPGGLIIFIIPSSFMDSGDTKVKKDLMRTMTLVDAYRLPRRMFEQTDIQTDIIVLKKN
jgi:type I restriction-modification system DNA methylase subunit